MMITIIAYILCGIALVYSAVGIFFPKIKHPLITQVIQGGTALLLLITLILRSMEMKYVALTGMFDSLIFFAMVIILISLYLNLQKRLSYPSIAQFGILFCAMGLLLVATSPIINKEALPPIPALQSGWLVLHVAFAFIGESFLAFAFVSALLYLFSKDENKQRAYDLLGYRSIIIGYSFFTLGALIFGAIWAENAWGRFWGWDPKETWALITWLIYSIYLHFRLINKASPRICSWISVMGFLATMFTLFGVNYLVRIGLHSY